MRLVLVLCACAAPAKPSESAAAIRVSLVFIDGSFLLRPSQQARDQRDQEEDHEHDEQDLGDLGRAGSDAGEAENRRDDGDDEKCKGPAQHDDSFEVKEVDEASVSAAKPVPMAGALLHSERM